MNEIESTPRNVLSDFAYYLADHGLLEKQAALNALHLASISKTSYITFLINEKLLSEPQLAQITAEYFGLPLCDIDAFNASLIPTEYLNIELVKKRAALPLFKKNGILYLAVMDPTDEYLYEIKFLTGLETRFLVSEPSKLEKMIDRLFNTMIFSDVQESATEQLSNITVDTYKEQTIYIAAYEVESATVVNYLNSVLLDAIGKNASDIHFEPYEEIYRIRFRQHGILYPMTSPPTKLANYLLARIKVMSDLDITEHRIPQDGRFKLSLSKKRAVDFRVSICPTLFGEKVVLRILDTTRTLQNLEQLGMDAIQQEHFADSLQHSQGMILVTGPTGSGKTVTLYSALHYLNSPEKNISTVEDPVEIPMEGVNQVIVNPKTGLTFATALRSFLRQDPDIIMVGEIRDLETAEIGVKAAQTGHLVLSTLHTNSAPETITRLMNMGVKPYNLASSLTIIIAQRLVRILCEVCKKKEELSAEVLIKEGFTQDELSDIQLYMPVGCDRCNHGFKGRVGIFEVMPLSTEMLQLIVTSANAIEIANQARREGISSLRESGLKKVKAGLTSLAELNRVFK